MKQLVKQLLKENDSNETVVMQILTDAVGLGKLEATKLIKSAKRKPSKTAFQKWFSRFVEEKCIDLERVFLADGNSGVNHIPCGVVIENINLAPKHEQAQIKNTLVMIDFKNGDVYHFFNHLAGALAI